MSAHTPTNLIRSFRCSAQEGFCAATVSRGNPALERETSYGFIYLEGQPPNEPFQGSILKTLKSFWPFWISNLQVFLSQVCVFLLLTHLKHTHPLASVLHSWRGRAEMTRNQACSGHLLMSSNWFLSPTAKKIPSDLSLFSSVCLSVTHTYLGKVSYEFQFMGIIKLQIVLGGHVGQTVKKTVPNCFWSFQ